MPNGYTISNIAQQDMQNLIRELNCLPKIADDVLQCGQILDYVECYIKHIQAVTAKFKLTPRTDFQWAALEIYCNKDIFEVLQNKKNIAGWDIKLNGPRNDHAFDDLSFDIYIGYLKDSDGNLTWMDHISGFAYDVPITRSLYESRFTLQIKDRLPAKKAARSASALE